MTLTIELDYRISDGIQKCDRMNISGTVADREAAYSMLGRDFQQQIMRRWKDGELTPEQCAALGLEAR